MYNQSFKQFVSRSGTHFCGPDQDPNCSLWDFSKQQKSPFEREDSTAACNLLDILSGLI